MRERLAAALLVVALMAPMLPAAPPAAAAAPTMADRDGDRLADDLAARLADAGPGERVPVLVALAGPEDAPEARFARHGSFEASQRFLRQPFGFAAALTPAQARAIAGEPGVLGLWLDAEVHATLDTAAASFGAAAARADFGTTGDGDGDPLAYSAADAVVCVIDTGIDAAHVDLDGGKVIGWRDIIGGRADPYDDNGHGTHVASIVAGTGEGNGAYKGVAPGAALVGVKVLNSAGSGTFSGVQAGVAWCVDQKEALGIEVLSLSLGTSSPSDGQDPLSLAVDAAADAGLLVVVAAGNGGPTRQTIGSPGAAAKALTVAAMYDTGERGFALAAFSSRGPTLDARVKPDLSAPGVAITAAQAGTGSYVALSGTSMATPFVSGVAALLVARGATPAEAGDAMLGTAEDWGVAGADNEYGRGRLRAYEALRSVAGGGGAGPGEPVHQHDEGQLTSAGQATLVPYIVTDPAVPLALTLIMSDWTQGTPDFELYLYGPGATPGDHGAALAKSEGATRQEVVRVIPPGAGRYVAEVYDDRGGGAWLLDASGALLRDDAAPVTSTVVTGPLGAAGWFTGPASVALSASDAAAGVDATYYRVDAPGAPGQRYAGPFSLADDGAHAVEAWSVDLLGNVEAPRRTEVRMDATAPASAHTLAGLQGAASWWRGPVGVALQGSDATSGLARIRWALDEAGEQAYGSPFEVAGDGARRLRYRGDDVAGNVEAMHEVLLSIDATPPSTTLNPSGIQGDDGWWRSAVTVTPVGFDATSGLAAIARRVDGGAWSSSLLPFDVAGEGAHEAQAFSTDTAGNAEAPRTLALRIDTVAPATSLALSGPAADHGWWRGAVAAAFAAQDATSGVARTLAGLDGAAPREGPVSIAGDGLHRLVFHSRDAAGNAEAEQVRDVPVDATPPATALLLAGPAGLDGWFRGPVQLALEARDATSGVAATALGVDGPLAPYRGPVGIAREGRTALDFASRDVAGNDEALQRVALRIDATAPAVSLAVGLPRHEGARLYVRNITPLTVEAEDAVSGVRVREHRVGEGSWLAQAAFTLAGTDGLRTLGYRGSDVAGNDAPAASREVFLDDTAPDLALLSPRPGSAWVLGQGVGPAPAPPGSALDRVVVLLGSEVAVQADALDPLVGGDAAGVAGVDFLVDGALAASLASPPWAWTWATGGLRLGDHTLTAQARDHLGNAASRSVKVTVVDR